MVATTSHKETEHWCKENLGVFQDVFWILNLKKKTEKHSQQRSKSWWVFKPWAQFRLGFGAKMNTARIKTLHVISTVWYWFYFLVISLAADRNYHA